MNRLWLIVNCSWKLGDGRLLQFPIIQQQQQYLLQNQKLRLNTTITAERYAATATNVKKGNGSSSIKDDWHQIYRLPLVRMAASFNSLKIYQGSLTVLGVPLAIALEQAGHIPTQTSGIFAAIGISGTLTLALFSLAVKNLIGFVYINPAGNLLKLAYVDYWGRRRERVIELDDLKLSWHEPRLGGLNFYRKVHMHSDAKRSFKLLNNYGVIVDPDAFIEVFGN